MSVNGAGKSTVICGVADRFHYPYCIHDVHSSFLLLLLA